MYMALKHSHMMFVLISVSFLVIRFYWMLGRSTMLDKKWVKVMPHANDTLLLATALGLCVTIHQYPFQQLWLTEKLFAVFAYILMGFMALKGRTMPLRWIALVGAMGWIALIVRLALTKQPLFLAS